MSDPVIGQCPKCQGHLTLHHRCWFDVPKLELPEGAQMNTNTDEELVERVARAIADAMNKGGAKVAQAAISAVRAHDREKGEPVAWRYRLKKDKFPADTFSNQPPDRVIDVEKYDVTPLYSIPTHLDAKQVSLGVDEIEYALKSIHAGFPDAAIAVLEQAISPIKAYEKLHEFKVTVHPDTARLLVGYEPQQYTDNEKGKSEVAEWTLVPVNPTSDMILAGVPHVSTEAVYRAMLKAAPPQPDAGREELISLNRDELYDWMDGLFKVDRPIYDKLVEMIKTQQASRAGSGK